MPIDALTPYAHVVDLGRSIDVCRLLGLEVANAHEEEGRLVWALLTNPAADPKTGDVWVGPLHRRALAPSAPPSMYVPRS
jgi:hypothetical protein